MSRDLNKIRSLNAIQTARPVELRQPVGIPLTASQRALIEAWKGRELPAHVIGYLRSQIGGAGSQKKISAKDAQKLVSKLSATQVKTMLASREPRVTAAQAVHVLLANPQRSIAQLDLMLNQGHITRPQHAELLTVLRGTSSDPIGIILQVCGFKTAERILQMRQETIDMLGKQWSDELAEEAKAQVKDQKLRQVEEGERKRVESSDRELHRAVTRAESSRVLQSVANFSAMARAVQRHRWMNVHAPRRTVMSSTPVSSASSTAITEVAEVIQNGNRINVTVPKAIEPALVRALDAPSSFVGASIGPNSARGRYHLRGTENDT